MIDDVELVLVVRLTAAFHGAVGAVDDPAIGGQKLIQRQRVLRGMEIAEIREQVAARKRIVAQRVAALGEPQPADVFGQLAEMAIGLAVGFVLEGTGMHCAPDAGYADNSYQGAAVGQLRRTLDAVIEQLPPLQRRVVQGHYLHGQPFGEIAKAHQLTAGRVAQLHKDAMASLRGLLRARNVVDISF